jgi:AcrR family transcriptional regulator
MSFTEAPVIDQRSAPERSRAETRRRLVAAGTQLFAENGLHAVTSARIARAAGVATGTFYLHFRDKQALFREIVFGALAELRARQERAVQGTAPGSREELRALAYELLAFAADNRDLIRIVFGRGHEAGSLAEDVLDAVVPDIERRFARQREAGLAPADLHVGVAAQARAATLVRVIAWWVEEPTRATRDEIVTTLLHIDPCRPRPA